MTQLRAPRGPAAAFFSILIRCWLVMATVTRTFLLPPVQDVCMTGVFVQLLHVYFCGQSAVSEKDL